MAKIYYMKPSFEDKCEALALSVEIHKAIMDCMPKKEFCKLINKEYAKAERILTIEINKYKEENYK